MEFLKEIFGENALTYEQLVNAVNEKGLKVANLTDGGYVAKSKFDDRAKADKATIDDLMSQLSAKNDDIKSLTDKFNAANGDAQKYAEISTELQEMKSRYEKDKNDWQAAIKARDYESAVKEAMIPLKFSSESAKKEFFREAVNKNFPISEGKLMGFDDYVTQYKKDDASAFLQETPPEKKEEPQIVAGSTTPPPSKPSSPFNFNFTGVRKKGD